MLHSYVFLYTDLHFIFPFPACTWRAQDPGGQPPPPGLQAAGERGGGAGLRRPQRHGLLRGQPAVRLQRDRVADGALAAGAQAQWDGEVMEDKQR